MSRLTLSLFTIAILLFGHAASAQVKAPPSAPPAKRSVKAKPLPLPRGYVLLGAGYALGQNDFKETTSIRTNAEDGSYTASYDVGGAPAFGGAAAIRVWKLLGVRASGQHSSTGTPATLDATVPHPFFFNLPRTLSVPVNGQKRSETSVGVQVLAMFQLNRRSTVAAFVGPSWLSVSQGIVQGFNFSDSYPYDTISLTSAPTANHTGTSVVVSGGVDANFFITNSIGLAGSFQIVQGDVELAALNDKTRSLSAGGPKIALGVSFKIP